MRVRGDEQRGLVERDLRLRARHQLGEALGDVQGSTVAPFGRLVTMSGTAAPSSSHQAPEQVHEVVATRLRAVGQRLTSNRQALLDALTAAARPLTIPEILDERPDLAQSSVYRNLVVLEEAGIVHRVLGTDEFARWELTEDLAGHHHHLICAQCGRGGRRPGVGRTRTLGRRPPRPRSRALTGFRTQHHRLDPRRRVRELRLISAF